MNDGATRLYIAAQQGRIEVVNALIVARAGLNKARDDYATPWCKLLVSPVLLVSSYASSSSIFLPLQLSEGGKELLQRFATYVTGVKEDPQLPRL